MTDMSGRICLVTGATRGIGRATAEALAKSGAHVLLHGRDSASVGAVCREMIRYGQVTGVVGDLGSLAAVRKLASDIAAQYPRLDVLVNNAGTGTRRRQTTVDGYERTFAINHLAPFLLTNLLLERLKASKAARVVTVSSMAHRNVTARLRRPELRQAQVQRAPRLWRVEAREHPVHARAREPARRQQRYRELPASRRGRDEHFRRILGPHRQNLQRAVPAVHAVARERREDERLSRVVARGREGHGQVLRQVPRGPACPRRSRCRGREAALGDQRKADRPLRLRFGVPVNSAGDTAMSRAGARAKNARPWRHGRTSRCTDRSRWPSGMPSTLTCVPRPKPHLRSTRCSRRTRAFCRRTCSRSRNSSRRRTRPRCRRSSARCSPRCRSSRLLARASARISRPRAPGSRASRCKRRRSTRSSRPTGTAMRSRCASRNRAGTSSVAAWMCARSRSTRSGRGRRSA